MQTVFSHIVQKELSQKSENVATEALAFMLSREATRNGMMKLLKGIVPSLPHLRFRTQQMEGDNRPDLWGNDEAGRPHVFVENKFWAGLTENQPVSYLRILEKQRHPTILLMVAPKAREHTLARELKRKLDEAGISATEQGATAGIARSFTTGVGPILALTSWETLSSFLELELTDDRAAKSDLLQLQALCEAVDNEAFAPISAEQVSDQLTPAFILQLNSIVLGALDLAVTQGALRENTAVGRDATRIGHFADVGKERKVGIWIGIHFGLWKKYGGTPLWVVFSTTDWGRAREVQPLLEDWAARTRVFTAMEKDDFVVAVDLPVGEEKATVVKAIATRLKLMEEALSNIAPRPAPSPKPARKPKSGQADSIVTQ